MSRNKYGSSLSQLVAHRLELRDCHLRRHFPPMLRYEHSKWEGVHAQARHSSRSDGVHPARALADNLVLDARKVYRRLRLWRPPCSASIVIVNIQKRSQEHVLRGERVDIPARKVLAASVTKRGRALA